MATTVAAFNHMLKRLVQDLQTAFPGNGKINTLLAGFDLFTEANPTIAMDVFVDSVAPYAEKLEARDATLFNHVKIPGGIDLTSLWQVMTDGNKNATWEYLTMLYALGVTVKNMPPELLQSIESLAQNCASKIEDGNFDIMQLGSMLGSMMGGIGGGDAGDNNVLGNMGPLASLFGALSTNMALGDTDDSQPPQ
jgi:hypothetical protein